jgi:hypothetical protein
MNECEQVGGTSEILNGQVEEQRLPRLARVELTMDLSIIGSAV